MLQRQLTLRSKVVATKTQLDINVEGLLLNRGCLTAPAATLTLQRPSGVESKRIPMSTIRVQFDWEPKTTSAEAAIGGRRLRVGASHPVIRIMKKYGQPRSIVTDGLCSEIGAADRHEVGGRLNNRAENSHQPFRRRERAMQRFRNMKTLQKFSSVHAQVHNHFTQERHLVTRQIYKQKRSAALAAWRARSRAGFAGNLGLG